MNKASLLTVFLVPALLLAAAPFAHAQVYSTYGTTVYPTSTYTTPVYSTPTYTNASNGSCIELTAPMTIGASDYLNGGQVSELQTFLVRDGILSSAYVTGYYGNLTANAVAQFQSSRGIAAVGVVGPATRAAIAQVSCGTTGIVSPANPIYPTNPTYPINPGGPIIFSRPDLNSLSVSYNTGTPVITIQGYGFSPTSNTVYFGNQAITNVASNGSQITFNVPNIAPGNYEIYVTNTYGSSNSLSYTVGNNTNTGGNCYISNGSNYTYSNNGYTSQCTGCVPTVYNPLNGYNANSSYNNCGTNNSQVNISYLSPSEGSTGIQIAIQGSGFSQYGNIVHFGNGGATNVSSTNGSTIYFTIPTTISPCSVTTNGGICAQYIQEVTAGSYPIYVTNQNGATSNTVNFQVFTY